MGNKMKQRKADNSNLKLDEELAKVDLAFTESQKALPSLDDDWEFAYMCLQADLIDQINRIMKEENLTQAKLAKRIGVSRSWISKLLNETANFQLDTIAKLAIALDRDIAMHLIRKTEYVIVESSAISNQQVLQLEEIFTDSQSIENPDYSSFEPSSISNKSSNIDNLAA